MIAAPKMVQRKDQSPGRIVLPVMIAGFFLANVPICPNLPLNFIAWSRNFVGNTFGFLLIKDRRSAGGGNGKSGAF